MTGKLKMLIGLCFAMGMSGCSKAPKVTMMYNCMAGGGGYEICACAYDHVVSAYGSEEKLSTVLEKYPDSPRLSNEIMSAVEECKPGLMGPGY